MYTHTHTFMHIREKRREFQVAPTASVSFAKNERSRKKAIASFHFFRITVLLPPYDQRKRTRRKLWITSPVERLFAIDIRRRMCSLPKPWPTWPVSDSAWPAYVALRLIGTTYLGLREVLRP